MLQDLGYLNDDRTVKLKGRVACEINSGDELVGTEMIFSGVLADLEPAEAVALLSALVFQEKGASPPELTPTLQQAKDRTCPSHSRARACVRGCPAVRPPHGGG